MFTLLYVETLPIVQDRALQLLIRTGLSFTWNSDTETRFKECRTKNSERS